MIEVLSQADRGRLLNSSLVGPPEVREHKAATVPHRYVVRSKFDRSIERGYCGRPIIPLRSLLGNLLEDLSIILVERLRAF